MAHSTKMMASSLVSPDAVQSELLAQPWAPTAEEIEEEEEAAREYERRRQEARRKKEVQQARELQRVLEEKRAMAEELEELRGSRATSSGQPAAGGLGGSAPASANASGAGLTAAALAEVEATAQKRLGKMKRKYEKKLAAAREALEDLQEVSCCHDITGLECWGLLRGYVHIIYIIQDSSYQRKQFVEAATEQEKDLRLYELICKSVLSEKDFKTVGKRSVFENSAQQLS
jgi:hypothetical protein